MLADPTGQIVVKARAFDDDLVIADVVADEDGAVQIKPTQPAAPQPANLVDEIYQALVLGTRDYAHKNGFQESPSGPKRRH